MSSLLVDGKKCAVRVDFWKKILALKMKVLNLGQYFDGSLIESKDGRKTVLICPKTNGSMNFFEINKVISAVNLGNKKSPEYISVDQLSFSMVDLVNCTTVYALQVKVNNETYLILLALPYHDDSACELVIDFFEEDNFSYQEVQSLIEQSSDHELFHLFYESNYSIIGVLYRKNESVFIPLSSGVLINSELRQLARTSQYV
jgi:hypothetical protein